MTMSKIISKPLENKDIDLRDITTPVTIAGRERDHYNKMDMKCFTRFERKNNVMSIAVIYEANTDQYLVVSHYDDIDQRVRKGFQKASNALKKYVCKQFNKYV